jgi:hypothetical protein
MTKRTRLAASVLAVLGVAALVALVSRTPAFAPTDVSSPAPSTEPGERPDLPAPEAWADVTWEPLAVDPLGPADVLRRVDGIVGDGRLLIAWGRTPMPGRNQFNDMGAVFASGDGVTWQTIAIEHGVNALSASTISDVAIGPRGILAVGSVCCDPEQSAIWRSPDGLAWERLNPDDTLHPNTYLSSVHVVPDGWLVLAYGGPDTGSELLFSADGLVWQRVLEADAIDGGSPGISAVTQGPRGFVAVGTVEAEGGSYDGAVWRSDDGRAWERTAVADPALVGGGEAQLHAVVGHAGGLFATGIFGTMEQRLQCEQLGKLASVDDAPPRDRTDRTSCRSGDEQQWASDDGTRWIRVEPEVGMERPIEFRVVTAGGPGLLVLGESSGPESPDTLLFGSADGITWHALGSEKPMLTDVAVGLVVRGREIIALTDNWDGVTTTLNVWRGRAR